MKKESRVASLADGWLDRILMTSGVRRRRAELRAYFDVARQFPELEESCIPSYVHSNSLAAWVSWTRLQKAAQLYNRWASPGPILDFGSATGEIAHLISSKGQYHFVDFDDLVANALVRWLPQARRVNLTDIGPKQFASAFALDSLEHNENIEPLVARLETSLNDSGVLILSGPTENLLYRIGRRLAGFDGHYHHQTIWDIEAAVALRMSLLERSYVPISIGAPLFSISAWRVAR